MPEKPSQLRDRQDAIDKIRLTHDIAEQKRIEIENNSELGEEEKQQELEIINRETEVIVADIKRQAKELSKDDTFLNWVRKKFSKGVLVIAVLKTMAGISASAEAEQQPVGGHDGPAEIQTGISGSDSSSSIFQEGKLSDKKDTYQAEGERDYSPDFHVEEGELDFSAEVEQVNDMIKSFCEQRGIQPWEVKATIHFSSSSSIEGNADSNYDLAGEGLLQAQKTFDNSLEKVGINSDNLQMTAENLGEASVVDGKILNESEARQAISQELGIDESKIDRLVHSYNHGGKLSAEEKRIMDKYIGDSRGVRMIVELEDLSERDGFTPHVSEGFTEHVSSDTKVVYTLVEQDPALVIDSAIIPDKRPTTEEIYEPKDSNSSSIFRVGPREIPSETEISSVSPDDPVPSGTVPNKSKPEVVTNPDFGTNDKSDSVTNQDRRSDENGDDKISVELIPDSTSDVDPGDENDGRDRRGRGENGRTDRGGENIDIIDTSDNEDIDEGTKGESIDIIDPPIVDPPIIDPIRGKKIESRPQVNPNIQATRRRGSGGPSRRGNKKSGLEDWNRVINKGGRPRSVGGERKMVGEAGIKVKEVDRKKRRKLVKGLKEKGLERPVLDNENYN